LKVSITELLHRGDCLYRQGQFVEGLFRVRTGALKLFTVSDSGEQQVIGFALAGDIVGFDTLGECVSRTTAEALETSAITQITVSDLTTWEPATRERVFSKMRDTMHHDIELLFLIAKRSAEHRVGWFLGHYASRLEASGLDRERFTLPMSRADIGDYLGLATETVCRQFAHLKELGILGYGRRRVVIHDFDRLRELYRGPRNGRRVTNPEVSQALH
jgi:CRP/FNR family transcriptional regulator